jgi:two-component system sensor histidine kinase ChvG
MAGARLSVSSPGPLRRLARHAARIRYRLLLVNLIVAAVPVIGIVFARMHETQLLDALEQDMIHQAELVRAIAIAEPTTPLEGVLAAAARDTRTRIRLLDAHGAVVADSHRSGPPEGAERPVPYLIRGEAPSHAAQVPAAVPLADRAEVRAALAGRYGAATRLWDRQDRVYLFAALPIVRDGRVDGVVYLTRSTHDVKLQLLRLRAWLIKLLLACVIVTALLSLVLATTIASPLSKLTRRAQRIAARQPVEAVDGLGSRADEIGQLARAVDAMTDELERRAHDARTLAADISHEFKTPLAGIRGAAELLRDGAADEPDSRDRFLRMIEDDTARLDRHVSHLLELARVEDDRGVTLPADLHALATACAARPWPVVVSVSVSAAPPVLPAPSLFIPCRAAQIAVALDNLVANAAHHADADTPVQIALDAHPAHVRVTVSNHGLAVSAAAQRRVWDRFYSTRTATGGSGLGLAIVRSVALAHGGTVGLSCKDGITSFWFQLRRA